MTVLHTVRIGLWNRLKANQYPEQKIREYMSSESFQIIFAAAKTFFPQEIVYGLPSDNKTNFENNIRRIKLWVRGWKNDNAAQS